MYTWKIPAYLKKYICTYTRPSEIIRDVVAPCQTAREDVAIVDICAVVFSVRLLFFHSMSASRHSDSTPDSRRQPLCVHDERAFRAVQAALQTTTAILSSHELVSYGSGGNSTCL